jgi:hypothetical protein
MDINSEASSLSASTATDAADFFPWSLFHSFWSLILSTASQTTRWTSDPCCCRTRTATLASCRTSLPLLLPVLPLVVPPPCLLPAALPLPIAGGFAAPPRNPLLVPVFQEVDFPPPLPRRYFRCSPPRYLLFPCRRRPPLCPRNCSLTTFCKQL